MIRVTVLFSLALCLGACSDENGEIQPVQEDGQLAGITAAHNAVRQQTASMPDLVWDEELAGYAQQWANELVKQDCGLEHRPNTGEFAQQHGENLFAGGGTTFTPDQVVGLWAAEVSEYNYSDNSCTGVCGHYTQIVWADSLKLGCAIGKCSGSEVWVCNYSPPGNFIGRKPY